MQNEGVIPKIKKLLALSESPNEHEARRASEKVQELLLLHKLSLDDLSSQDSGVEAVDVLSGAKTTQWKKTLLIAVACFYDCEVLTTRRRGAVRISVVGGAADAQTAILMYEYFCKAIDRVVKEEKLEKRIQRGTPTFRHGAALRVWEKLEARKELIAKEGMETDSGNISALVVKSTSERAKAAIDDWFATHEPKAKVSEMAVQGNANLTRGYIAGDRIGVDEQLNPAAKPQGDNRSTLT